MSTHRVRIFVLCLAFVGVLVSSASQAQYMVDMSLLKCGQYLAMPPDQSRIYAAWMSGWFNQKMGYTYINLEAYARNVENVKAWCAANPGEPNAVSPTNTEKIKRLPAYARNMPMVDLKRFATNKKLVEKFCRGHKKDNLMNAIRKVAF